MAVSLDYFDVAVYVKKYKALLLTDIHIGIEEAMQKSGIHMPLDSYEKVMKRTNRILKYFREKYLFERYSKIIILGDLKHEFGKISQTEWSQTLKYLDFLARETKELILLKGNHDNILQPILNKRNLAVKSYEQFGYFLALHGDVLPEEFVRKKLLSSYALSRIRTIIIGHEHPAISLQHGPRTELYKCFLVGRYKRKELVVMPSLNSLSAGTDILKQQLLSPFLQKNLSAFRVKIVDEKTGECIDFGKVSDV